VGDKILLPLEAESVPLEECLRMERWAKVEANNDRNADGNFNSNSDLMSAADIAAALKA